MLIKASIVVNGKVVVYVTLNRSQTDPMLATDVRYRLT